MNKINIATNIYSDIQAGDIQKLKSDFTENFDINFEELVIKDINSKESTRYAIDDINLKTIINDLNLWERFFDLLNSLKDISVKIEEKNDIQFWVIDDSNNSAINMAFSLNGDMDTRLLLNSLKDFLNEEVFNKKIEEQSKNIILVGWDTKNQKWRVDVI